LAKRFDYAGIAVLAVLFAVNVYRGWSQSISHDEAYTYHVYVIGTVASLFDYYDANHHFLYTLLAKLTLLAGVLYNFPFAF
jgi:hypothetical protein